jgi:hypothetical protein
MAENAIIGQVAIKVIPDTSRFRREAERELKAVEKVLRDVKIGFEAKTAEAVAEARKAKRAAENAVKKGIRLTFDYDDPASVKAAMKRLERAVKDASANWVDEMVPRDQWDEALGALAERLDEIRTLDLRVDFDDTQSVRNARNKIQAELDRMAEVEFKVKHDEDSLRKALHELDSILAEEEYGRKAFEFRVDNEMFKQQLSRVTDAVNRAFDGVTLKPEIDERQIRRDITKLYERLDEARTTLKVHPELSDREKHRLREEIEDIEAKIAVGLNEATQRSTQLRLAFLGRTRFVTFTPVVDKAAAARVSAVLTGITAGRLFTDFFKGIKNFLTDLDKAVPKMMTLTSLFTNLGGYVLTAASNLVTFTMGLAQISGAALALPGILGGMAIGVGATVAALKDFNQVFPNAQAALEDLQDSMSARFWAKAEAPFRKFADVIFPQFSKSINKTSTSLGGFFGNFAASATGIFNGPLARMFDDLNKSIDIAGTYTDHMVDSIRRLGEVGAGYLPKLATWFGEITKDFDGWLTKKGPKGLEALIDLGVQNLKDLGVVIRETGQAFAGLARAAEAAGGSTIATVADTMTRVSDAINKADFQRNLTAALEGAHKGMSAIANKSGPAFRSLMVRVSDLLANVLPKAGETLGKALDAIFDALDQPQVQASIEGLFDNIGKSVDNLAPMMPALADALSNVISVMGFLGQAASGIVAPAFQTLYSLIKPFADLIGAIPTPVLTLVAQIAALAIGVQALTVKLNAAALSVRAFATSMATANTGVGLFGGKIGKVAGVAGIGGMAASMASAKVESDGLSKALGVVGSVGTGAAMGAMVGSVIPVLGTGLGAAAGAAIGLGSGIYGVVTASRDAKPPMDALETSTRAYKDTLDATTGAITQVTRAEAKKRLADEGLIGVGHELGLSTRTLIEASLGNRDAMQQVTQAYRDNKDIATRLAGSDLLPFLSKQRDELRANRDEWVKNYVEMNNTRDILQNFPKNIRTQIRALGAEPTKKQIQDILKNADNLTKRKRRILIELLNSKQINKQIDGIDKNLKDTGKAKPSRVWKSDLLNLIGDGTSASSRGSGNINKNLGKAGRTKSGLDTFLKDVTGKVGKAGDSASKGGKRISDNLRNGTAQARPDLSGFNGAFSSNINSLQGTASSGGSSIGNNLGAGIRNGISAWVGSVASAAANLVSSAMAAARRVAVIRSPSRAMMEIGSYLGEGLNIGLRSWAIPIENSARWIVSRRTLRIFDQRVKWINDAVKQTMKKGGKAYDKWAKDLRKSVNKLVKEFNTLTNKYKQLRQKANQFRNMVRDAMIDSASPIGQDIQTAAGMERFYAESLAKARRFATAMTALAERGLNSTTFEQLALAGPQAALAQAEAILQGGDQTVQQINKMQREIEEAAKATGVNASEHMFGPQLDKMEQQMIRMNNRIIRLTNKAMKQLSNAANREVPKVTKQFRQLDQQIDSAVKRLQKMNKQANKLNNNKNVNLGGNYNTNVQNTYNYYAAPNRSLSSEEELYSAMNTMQLAGKV